MMAASSIRINIVIISEIQPCEYDLHEQSVSFVTACPHTGFFLGRNPGQWMATERSQGWQRCSNDADN
jgi:hypothetical protein